MAEEIDLSPAEDAALERAWARVGPLLAPGRIDAPFAATGPDLFGLGDLYNLSRQEVLDALFDAAIDSFDLALPDAAFGGEDQPRVPAGQAGGGEWTSGGGAADVGETTARWENEDGQRERRQEKEAEALEDRQQEEWSALSEARDREDAATEKRRGKEDSVIERQRDREDAREEAKSERAAQRAKDREDAASFAREKVTPTYREWVRLDREYGPGSKESQEAWQRHEDATGRDAEDAEVYARRRADHPAAHAAYYDTGDAPFYSPDQPRVPAGSPGGGRWAGGVSPGTASARNAASDAVRAFASGQGSPTAAEAQALAGHLAKLTVAQIHDLRREHGLRGSAPSKAALVAKLAERFRAQRERNLPESVSTAVDTGASRGDNTPVGQTTPTGVQAVTATTKGPHEMTATEFHGQPVSRERAVRTTSVYRGVNRDEGTRRTPGVTRTVADARKYLDDVLWPVPKPWHTPPAGAVPAARERYLTPAPMPDVSAAGVRAAADAAIAAHTAGASLMVPERADEPKRPASVLALYPNGSLKRVMPHPDPGSNEMRGQVQEWDAVPEAVVARVRVLAHYHAVEAALAAGKPVRPEVLADYPDLAERYHA